MKNTTSLRYVLFILTATLLTCLGPSIAEKASNKPGDNVTEEQTEKSTIGSPNLDEINTNDNDMQLQELQEYQQPAENTNENTTTLNNKRKDFWDRPYILAAFSAIAILTSVLATWGARIANSSVKKLKKELEREKAARTELASEITFSSVKKLKKELEREKEARTELASEITLLENQFNQEKMQNENQLNEIRALATTAKTIPISVTTPKPMKQNESNFASITPNTPPRPLGPSKSGLIAALNNGGRHQLREAALSELNITSESENAFITGRSANTELEEVTGGGSYLLVMLQGQPWLFPTEKTLKGFTAVQSSKGMFESEQQKIANCQLLEPALLEGSGNRWTIKRIGRIAIP